jgi:hypothetical protein
VLPSICNSGHRLNISKQTHSFVEVPDQAAELAEKSAERATRVAACEFLHAAILWMVGTNARRPMSRDAAEDFQSRPTAFHGILSRALPVALRLAAGAEPVARQLFEPLVMSLVHWFTRAARRCAHTFANDSCGPQDSCMCCSALQKRVL